MIPRGGGTVADVLIERDLVQEFGQHGSITDVAAGDFDWPNFQHFPVDLRSATDAASNFRCEVSELESRGT